MAKKSFDFAADLRRFWAMSDERLERVVRGAMVEMVSDMQFKVPGVTIGGVLQYGKMPYNSTDLLESLTFEVGVSTFVGADAHIKAMPNYELGEDITFYWTEPYAGYIERGDDRFPGWHYIAANAPKWPDLVVQMARSTRNKTAMYPRGPRS